MFPGGNLDARHDGAVPAPSDAACHADGESYRRAAVRECFEESGILLARGADGGLLGVAEGERERGRRAVHEGSVRFGEWVERMGGSPDLGIFAPPPSPLLTPPVLPREGIEIGLTQADGLIPFTRWITPPGPPKRFTTQMYLYLLPTTLPINSAFEIPTPDGGVEHTSAEFAYASAWLDMHHARKITMFPPQYVLLTLLAGYFQGADIEGERARFLEFLHQVPTSGDPAARGHPTSRIPWGDKVMSPRPVMGFEDGTVALGLDRPGREVEEAGGGRGGDRERVVIVDLRKGGPWNYGVKRRAEVVDEQSKL